MVYRRAQETIRYSVVLSLSLALLLSKKDIVSAVKLVKPSPGDFALCELSAEVKDKFLDEHNKFRGMVDPPAADMEYLVSRIIHKGREMFTTWPSVEYLHLGYRSRRKLILRIRIQSSRSKSNHTPLGCSRYEYTYT